MSTGNEVDHEVTTEEEFSRENLAFYNGKRKLRRFDSLELESGKYHDGHGSDGRSWAMVLQLAFQSIGVVYGDIGTSPLYVFQSAFPKGIKREDDILGVLSLILYTLTIIPLVKYVLIVLRANDNGKGGTFALYSLICRYAKVSFIPSQQAEDTDVSNYKMPPPSRRLKRASWIKTCLEGSLPARYLLLLVTMLGTSMVIGDGVLTPCISVLSAVSGIRRATAAMTEDRVLWIAVVILVILFSIQRFGTDKVGYTFAPVICVWLFTIAGIGAYNLIKYNPAILKALNPNYIVLYFKRNKSEAWISLGGVVLAITGTEALFADVGHFSVKAIQISMCSVVYPCLILTYSGQAAFLTKHQNLVFDAFYESVPEKLYWMVFAIAVMASIIASQAMISGTFSIIQQSLSLGCFPRVKIIHTSAKYEGQVYIPEMNFLLMIASVSVTLAFRKTSNIGNAYGIAVVFAETITSAFIVLIMLMIWKVSFLFVIAYVLVICTLEYSYLSSVLYKFVDGGYLPLAFATVLMVVMFVWNDVYRKRYHYELENKISSDEFKELAEGTQASRLPGMAIFYSDLVHGIPPLFKQYVQNVPALHTVLVFASFKSLPISNVPEEERFVFRRVEPRELNVYRCVARYGYTDTRNEEAFEPMLLEKMKQFIMERYVPGEGEEEGEEEREAEARRRAEMVEDLEVLDRACGTGIVHFIGESEVVAAKGAGAGKRILIDYAYNFIKRNVRQQDKIYGIPRKYLLKVGITYEL